MKRIILVLVFGISALLHAQGEKITKEIGSFGEVKVFDGLAVNLIPSNMNKVVITGEDSKSVSVINKDGILKIRMDLEKIFSGHRTFVELHYKQEINVLDVNEDARITSQYAIKQNVLEVRAQEGGEVEIGVTVEQLIIKSVTGGGITLSGSSTNQDININTGGRYFGRECKTDITTVDVNAGGVAEIFAKKYVEASVKAGGRVQVYGDPEKMDETTVFGGTITRM